MCEAAGPIVGPVDEGRGRSDDIRLVADSPNGHSLALMDLDEPRESAVALDLVAQQGQGAQRCLGQPPIRQDASLDHLQFVVVGVEAPQAMVLLEDAIRQAGQAVV